MRACARFRKHSESVVVVVSRIPRRAPRLYDDANSREPGSIFGVVFARAMDRGEEKYSTVFFGTYVRGRFWVARANLWYIVI